MSRMSRLSIPQEFLAEAENILDEAGVSYDYDSEDRMVLAYEELDYAETLLEDADIDYEEDA